ncbi:circadian clock protein KaiC [Herbaspirillum sp. HC18]|nr:circadian clock protein KaiC [Herbaspirillum sp. HC18]
MAVHQDDPFGNSLSTGITGLDEILGGGLARDKLYLVEGAPGSGKTTMALQFLIEGVRQGEPALYITLSETAAELRMVGLVHGWSMEGVHIHEVLPSEKILDPQEQYTIFDPSEIELGTTTQNILSAVEHVRPARVVLDSLSELQLLAANPFRYRRQVLAFKQFFSSRSCTTLLLDDRTSSSPDSDLQTRSVAHAVISLSRVPTDYGGIHRQVEVLKYRGREFREGVHDYKIRKGGLVVYPRLVAFDTRMADKTGQLSTSLKELDTLLGGGIERGSSTLVAGPPGAGKSSLAAQLISSGVRQKLRAALFLFEESANSFLNRTDGLGIDLRTPLSTGQLSLEQIDPAQLTTGEFIHLVRDQAHKDAKIIVIDSLNGLLHAMPNERLLTTYLHELLTYLSQQGVVTILVGIQQEILGPDMSTETDASYLADNVILLRYFETAGEVRQAISVFKKRGGAHERTLRQLFITSTGIHIGPVLRQFRGVLTGVPIIVENPVIEENRSNG